jgi:hypothetical protein
VVELHCQLSLKRLSKFNVARKAFRVSEARMSILTHGHRRGLHRTRRTGRMDIDDVLRSTDVTVHIIVLALLIAFASLLWYAYGA